jgi:hypothetical protein
MAIDWNTTELPAQLAKYNLPPTETLAVFLGDADCTHLKITVEGLDDYAQSWGSKSGVWLVLAVTKMLSEILEDYRANELPMLACNPPAYFEIAAKLEQEQEISHRILTAYNEIYAVLLRTHRQPSSSVWHRRATMQYFPQLTIETNSTEDSPSS